MKSPNLATEAQNMPTRIRSRMPEEAGSADVKNDKTIYKTVKRFADGSIAATLEVIIPARLEPTFDFVVAENVLPKVLTGYQLLPAVVRTSDNTGPWDRPGTVRTVHLADGTTAREQVTAYEAPRYFAYRTSDYTFALRYLATHAEGQWWFEERNNGTKVRWTYTFHPRNWFSAALLAMFVRTQWVGLMRTCIMNLQRILEAAQV